MNGDLAPLHIFGVRKYFGGQTEVGKNLSFTQNTEFFGGGENMLSKSQIRGGEY